MRTTDKMIENQRQKQIAKWGYERYPISARYNYWAVDFCRDKETADRHCLTRTYRTGISKGHAYELVDALLTD